MYDYCPRCGELGLAETHMCSKVKLGKVETIHLMNVVENRLRMAAIMYHDSLDNKAMDVLEARSELESAAVEYAKTAKLVFDNAS